MILLVFTIHHLTSLSCETRFRGPSNFCAESLGLYGATQKSHTNLKTTLNKFWSKAVLKILIWNQSSVKSFMNIKKKKPSKWISKEGTFSLLVILFIWEESFSISHSSIMNSENHWRAKKMDVLANYRPGAERKFPDHYRILVAAKAQSLRPVKMKDWRRVRACHLIK